MESAGALIRDVCPRDGLQPLPLPAVPVETKVELVNGLARSGVRRIEVGSFVSRRAVPQMADTAAVFAATAGLAASREALVVDSRGAAAAIAAGADVVAAVIAASETFSQQNVKASIAEAGKRLAEVGREVKAAGGALSVYIATAFGCAHEGRVSAAAVMKVTEMAVEAGASELTLADTAGTAGPRDVTRMVTFVRQRLGATTEIGLHFHNTRGLGLVNARAGLDCGVRRFDASTGGLGGCPFSPGATGNVATEDLVYMLELEGIPTGIDIESLLKVSSHLRSALPRAPFASHLADSGPRPW